MNFLVNFFQKGASLWLTLSQGASESDISVADEAVTSGGWIEMLPTILIWIGLFAVLYFILIRPQRKRDKQQAAMQQALKVGDKVLTSSGFYGKIVDVGTDAFMIEFGDSRGIRVPVRKIDVLAQKAPDMSPPSRETMAIDDKKEDK